MRKKILRLELGTQKVSTPTPPMAAFLPTRALD